jgi:hypothetical protein
MFAVIAEPPVVLVVLTSVARSIDVAPTPPAPLLTRLNVQYVASLVLTVVSTAIESCESVLAWGGAMILTTFVAVTSPT